MTKILLMNPNDPASCCDAVISVDDHFQLVAENGDVYANSNEPRATGGVQAEMLVQIVIV